MCVCVCVCVCVCCFNDSVVLYIAQYFDHGTYVGLSFRIMYSITYICSNVMTPAYSVLLTCIYLVNVARMFIYGFDTTIIFTECM